MNALIVTAAPTIELPESIVYAYASSDAVVEFATSRVTKLTDKQKEVVTYAYFRARYREGHELPVAGLARLIERTTEGAQYWVRKLFKIDSDPATVLSNDQCSSVMCAIMEM